MKEKEEKLNEKGENEDSQSKSELGFTLHSLWHHIYFPHTRRLTPQQDTSKDSVVTVQCAAVPSMVSELVLALSDPLFGSLPNCLHDVRVALAKLPLLVHQAGDVVTDYTGTECADIPTINKQKGGKHI